MKPQQKKQSEKTKRETGKKYEKPLHVNMSFQDLVKMVIQVKPPKKKKKRKSN